MRDPLRLKQILINLLSNAVKFTPNGGTVQLVGIVHERSTVLIRSIVADNGEGMTPSRNRHGADAVRSDQTAV